MENLGYYNGHYDLIENMRIPMDDRVSYYGDGVYDATYSRNHIIYAVDEHIDRFYNSAGLLQIEIPYTKAEFKDILQEMVNKVDCGEQFVYWQVTRGTAKRSHPFPENIRANVWIVLRPVPVKDTYKKIRLITMEDTRFLHCNIKTLNLIPNVMASQKAKLAGCEETVFHRGSIVTECAHSNVHILQNGVFKSHPNDHYVLPGTAKNHLIQACRKLGIPVDETPFTLDELMNADEVIVSSAGSFCLAAEEIDGKPVGGKAPELLKKLQDAVQEDFMKATEK